MTRKVSARKHYLEYPTYHSRLYLEYLTQHVCKTAQMTGRFCGVSEADLGSRRRHRELGGRASHGVKLVDAARQKIAVVGGG